MSTNSPIHCFRHTRAGKPPWYENANSTQIKASVKKKEHFEHKTYKTTKANSSCFKYLGFNRHFEVFCTSFLSLQCWHSFTTYYVCICIVFRLVNVLKDRESVLVQRGILGASGTRSYLNIGVGQWDNKHGSYAVPIWLFLRAHSRSYRNLFIRTNQPTPTGDRFCYYFITSSSNCDLSLTNFLSSIALLLLLSLLSYNGQIADTVPDI